MKLEQKLDAEFERMEIKPKVFHFVNSIIQSVAITIVDERLTWLGAQREIVKAHSDGASQHLFFFPATRLLDTLRKRDIYGVAICDKRDNFNRQRGRIIAKGRLLKHLKEITK